MVMFYSYVKLPEGNVLNIATLLFITRIFSSTTCVINGFNYLDTRRPQEIMVLISILLESVDVSIVHYLNLGYEHQCESNS